MKKILIILQIIFVAVFICGCNDIEGRNTANIKSPTNSCLSIRGMWKINSIKLIDESIIDDGEIIIGDSIEVSNESIKIENNIYVQPKFKLKVVDKNYVISYESTLTMETFMNGKDKVEVISVIVNNKSICEFILLEENRALILFRGRLLEVEKISSDISYSLSINKNNAIDNNNLMKSEYDSDIGLMLGLKTPRKEISKGVYSKEQYRTLWISFIDGTLQPVLQKDLIIFPRMKGIWRLESNVNEFGGFKHETFSAIPLERDNAANNINSTNNNIKINNNTYKNIKFVGNDYIAIEEYVGKDFNNEFPICKIIPIDNINSEKGISFDEIYSKDDLREYIINFSNTLKNLSKEDKIKLDTIVEYSNFALSRKDGKWNLVGRIVPNNGVGNGVDFPLRFKVSKKLVNYNTIGIPWKVLRGEIPFIRDAFTAPTKRLAIVILNDKLAIYEIERSRLKESPLSNIDLNEDEEVIMAEWCSGSYVQEWAKAFNDGIEIND